MVDNLWLYIFTYYIIFVIFIVSLLTFMQSRKQKKYKKEVENLELQKNILIDAPILTELAKAGELIKNEKLKEKYKTWEKDIEDIKNIDLTEINDLIIETDFLVDKRDYKLFLRQKTKTEVKIFEVLEKKEKIFEEIKDITLGEERNRAIITELKVKYRDIIKTFEESRSDFFDLEEVVKLQIENIDKRFLSFEENMENQDYEEVTVIVKSIDTLIKHMNTILEELPSILIISNNLIPKRIEEVNINYKKLLKMGYQLDYLNIEYNIKEIEKKVEDIKAKIRVLNLEDVLLDLKTMLEYFDSVFNNFEVEKLAKRSFDEQTISFKSKITKINSVMNVLYGKVSDVKYNYNFSNEQLNSFEELNEELVSINEDFDMLYETKKTTSFPYTRLTKELELLIIKLSNIEDRLDRYMQTVGNMQDDERRAREQLEDITELLRNSKYKIRDYKFPTLPNKYFIELKEASEAVREIIRELDKKPINIDVLNTRVDTARDLVFKFYNTNNELMKTALMAENAIMYGNRYKTNKDYIEEGLNKAEVLFLKGDYKKSLELTLNTIDMIEPGIHKKLLGLYEKEN